MKIIVPLAPNIGNSRMHWRVKLNSKKAYWETLDILRAMKQIPEPPEKAPAKAKIAVTLYLHSPMDDDNAMHRCKYTLDWLVTNGYLAGDSRKELEWSGLPAQVIDRKKPRLELTIVPILEVEMPYFWLDSGEYHLIGFQPGAEVQTESEQRCGPTNPKGE